MSKVLVWLYTLMTQLWWQILWIAASGAFIALGFVWGNGFITGAWMFCLVSVTYSLYSTFIPKSKQIYVSLDSLSHEDVERVVEVLKAYPNALVTIRRTKNDSA